MGHGNQETDTGRQTQNLVWDAGQEDPARHVTRDKQGLKTGQTRAKTWTRDGNQLPVSF